MPAETALASGVAAVVADLGVEFVTRVAPKGLAYVTSWVKGKQLVVIGQHRAGKTRFFQYLAEMVLLDEKDNDNRTVAFASTPTFGLKVTRDGQSRLQLTLRKAINSPGQLHPGLHAQEVFTRQPHAVVIILNGTHSQGGNQEENFDAWLRQFCDRYEEIWSENAEGRRRAEAIVVVLNKTDKMTPDEIDTKRAVCEDILSKLKVSRRSNTTKTSVKPCVLVNNPQGTQLVDRVITTLANALAR